jgi:hypothetical protein
MSDRKTAKVRKNAKAVSVAVAGSAPEAVSHITDSYDLPNDYGATSVTLIARDPYWIYAYWELAESSFSAAKKELELDFSHAKMALRVYDVTNINFDGSNANSFFDLDVGHARNWYANLWKDNVSYCAEIGMKTLSGRFLSFARSNFVTTPRAHMSWRREEIWMKATESSANAPYVNVEYSAPPDGSEEKGGQAPQARGESIVAKAVKRRAAAGRRYAEKSLAEEQDPLVRARKAKRVFLTEDDIRAYYYGISPMLRDLLKGRFGLGNAYDRYGKYFRLMSKRPYLTDMLMTKGGLARRRVGASEELVTPEEMTTGGASESLSRGASEHLVGVAGRKFFFEIGTELIVYGRTEADATVLLGDRKVDLGPDGTFTLRFALPDGKIPLDFAAISNDRVERREITTSVERAKTKYNP